MQLSLDSQTADYCLVQLQLGDLGPNGIHYHILALLEDLAIDGVDSVESSLLERFLQLPDAIVDMAEDMVEELNIDPLFTRLQNIADGRRSLLVARLTLHEDGLDPVTWSAIANVKEILRDYNHPFDPDYQITEQDLGLMDGELDTYPDPKVRVEGGWRLWEEWLDHRLNGELVNANDN